MCLRMIKDQRPDQGVSGKNVFVTGAAGFIGSHLVGRLLGSGANVSAFDNLSSGKLENIKQWLNAPNFQFTKGDILDRSKLNESINESTIVFHLAANPEVRIGYEDTRLDLEQNVICTHNLLEVMRKSETSKTIIFTSTSTVYGDAKTLPTPEGYGPLMPISNYGASKLACEAFVSSYSHLYGMKAFIFRFANIVGPRGHGVVRDFIQKLRKNPKNLEILGDGSQKKSYLIVDNCIDAFLHVLERPSTEPVNIFNVGSDDQITVNEIADIMIQEMGLTDVKKTFTGGIEGRGWRGDVKNMFLSIKKLRSLGWTPSHNSEQSIRLATRQILKELGGKPPRA